MDFDFWLETRLVMGQVLCWIMVCILSIIIQRHSLIIN